MKSTGRSWQADRKRRSGYYWIYFSDGWQPAHWDGYHRGWWLTGMDHTLPSRDLEFVSDRIPVPAKVKELTP